MYCIIDFKDGINKVKDYYFNHDDLPKSFNISQAVNYVFAFKDWILELKREPALLELYLLVSLNHLYKCPLKSRFLLIKESLFPYPSAANSSIRLNAFPIFMLSLIFRLFV